MAPRSTPPLSKGSYYPPNDAATYRDLLLFEERLKTNAASLQGRKARYQSQLLIAIAFLLSEVLLQTSLLSIPYKIILQRILPEIYTDDVQVELHPYFASGLLFVSVTTLVLFFASGMYSEKIAYANQYVPHANKALRSFNMYLNVRKPPLRSTLRLNPLSFLFSRPPEPQSPSSPTRTAPTTTTTTATNTTTTTTTTTTIPPIPPTTNPRGELIFSSRVDRSFRESYERYRATFERRREERQRLARGMTWWGWFVLKLPWSDKAQPTTGSSSPALGGAGMMHHTRTISANARGRASVGQTPSGSRRSSPGPGLRGGRRGGGTPPVRATPDRMRTRSMDL
ncbi:hypothetical protein PILCRDRAFT_347308 [Piloderma croceum F 1598]|uniref:Transmembrane protein 188 n=1 Tax=Piloderma croceum (strain F 1598) TaxID=765440 RepID=A0A0C3G5B1_PILCF|nr:hypothetical protein PILCRDRAFT_347308 [Piloderma croceum F 1598]